MTDIELEIEILRKFIKQYENAKGSDKCSYELDMREVLKSILGDLGSNLESNASLWHRKLAPRAAGKSQGILKPCSNSSLMNSDHKFHARAFKDPINQLPSPAWDRVSELEKILKKEQLLILKPSFMGVGMDLREAWRRLRRVFKKNT